MLPAKRAEWLGGIVRILWLSRMPSIYSLHPKGSMRIYYSSWFQRHIELPLWMGVTKMQDPKAMTILCPYYMNAFGDQEWPNRWDKLLGPAHAAFSMGGFPKAPLCPIVAMALQISCMVISQALRPCWSQTNHLELPMSWCSKTTSQRTCWGMWPLIKLWKLLPNFFMEDTSLSLGPHPGS